jgi:hypothetical protein
MTWNEGESATFPSESWREGGRVEKTQFENLWQCLFDPVRKVDGRHSHRWTLPRVFQLQIFMIGFVDDSSAYVNDFLNPNQSPDVLLERATTDAQPWNDLLCCSGGLEIPNCAYHLAHYGFSAAGGPVLQTFHQSQPAVRIQER